MADGGEIDEEYIASLPPEERERARKFKAICDRGPEALAYFLEELFDDIERERGKEVADEIWRDLAKAGMERAVRRALH